MPGTHRLRGLLAVAALTAAGSALAQPPGSGNVRPDEVRKLAGRLKGLDPTVGPLGLNLGMLQKMIADIQKANPGKSNEQVAKDLMAANKIDPSQWTRILDLVQKQPKPSGSGTTPPGNVQLPKTPPVEDRTPSDQQSRPDSSPPRSTRPTPEAKPTPSQTRSPDKTSDTYDPPPPSTPRTLPKEAQTTTPQGATAGRLEQYQEVARWWEKNVGPLSDTPAVRDMLQEMLTGRTELGGSSNSPLGELFESASKSLSGSDVAGLMPDSVPSFSGWRPPDVDAGRWSIDPRPSGYSGVGGGYSFGGGGGSWLPVVLFVAVAAVGLLLLWLWPRLTGSAADGPTAVAGLGPWPLDPRSITDRDGLVRAFEYLSVLVNGADARTWNHRTIADGFRRNVPGAAAGADELAEAYALARYSPAGQPIPGEVVAAARGHLCRIAGVVPA